MPPLILTLLLDPISRARLDTLRTRHFPPERNWLSAHLTLFHALPGDREPAIRADLRDLVEPPFPVRAASLRPLGRGVAYGITSDRLLALRARLAARWQTELTPQDRQRFNPHVTIQNKVDPATARALLAELAAGFTPFAMSAEGLSLWRYLGGPWEHVVTVTEKEELLF